MSGTIIVVSDNQHNVTTDVPHNSDEIVRTYMVSARFLDKYRAQFQDRKFTIDSTYGYRDLRGSQKLRSRANDDYVEDS